MRGSKLRISPTAMLAFAVGYFLDGSGFLAAVAPAVALHELGHYLALRCCGCRVRRISVGIFGLEMDYSGTLSPGEMLLCAAAGPLTGLLYGAAARLAGGDYFTFSGTLSLLLSGFNLLPVLPLDGGRMAEALLGGRKAALLSKTAAVLLLALSVAGMLRFRVWTLPPIFCWLLIRNLSVRSACIFRSGGIE